MPLPNQYYKESSCRDVLPERLYKHGDISPAKFKDKYRIPPARLQGYDYSSNGAYFVTICTKNCEQFFGEIVETHCNASLQNNEKYKNKFGTQSQTPSSIIRGCKGAATTQIHRAGFSDFPWQSRFHDHIIRNEKEFEKILEYIIQNPERWKEDCYF